MEYWVLEKWDIGLLAIFFLAPKLLIFKNEKYPFKINIPILHHSIIPSFHHSMCKAKAPGLNKLL
jgi:hypothetical protein